MESVREQIEYGTRCVHGTPLGTPGGADLMCGLCEGGFTCWVDDPEYALRMDLIGPSGAALTDLHQRAHWYESQVGSSMVTDRIMRDVTKNQALVATQEGYSLVWYAVRVGDGRWTEPNYPS